MKQSNFVISFFTALLLVGCGGVKVTQIGKLNMISNRNVDSQTNYSLIKSYMGGSEKELKKASAENVEDAIDQTVRNTPGGEFLKNVKLYLVERKSKFYFAVEGDVWGIKGEESFRGFKVGDMVQWKDLGGTNKGVITGLKDGKECMVKPEGKDDSKAIEYDKLTKVSE